MTFDSWITFVIIWTIVGLPLGPNAVHTISATVKYGYPRCILAPVGMALACIIHATIASLGVGAMLLVYPDLLVLLKILGAAYLAWLGIKLWRSQPDAIELVNSEASSGIRIVLSACLVSLMNPKAILSYVAVFVPFISPDSDLLPQLLILIPTATISVFINYIGYCLLAWPIRRWMDSDQKRRLFDRISGSMFIGFAGLLAFSSGKASAP